MGHVPRAQLRIGSVNGGVKWVIQMQPRRIFGLMHAAVDGGSVCDAIVERTEKHRIVVNSKMSHCGDIIEPPSAVTLSRSHGAAVLAQDRG